MSNLRVARDSSHKMKQMCTETNESCKCTPRSSGSYPGLETSGNCMYTLGFKELCLIMVANRTLTIACSRTGWGSRLTNCKLLPFTRGLEVALREARARLREVRAR